MTVLTAEQVTALQFEATPGPWSVLDYDAGDCSWYDHNGPCPSIVAPENLDYGIVHWDGFKQQYWSACDGSQRKIDANATLIAAAPDLAETALAALAENERLKFGIRAVIYSHSHRAGVGGPLVSLDQQPDYIQDLERVLKEQEQSPNSRS
jgi:hypothetical protein